MGLRRCEKGHFYDSDKYVECPHCNGYDVQTTLFEARLKSYEPIDGKWRFDSLLGTGSFGRVYKIVNINDPNDMAALKAISIEKHSDLLSGEEDFDKTADFFDEFENSHSFEKRLYNAEKEIELLRILNDCKYLVKMDKDYRFDRTDGNGVDLMMQMELLSPVVQYFETNGFSEKELLRLGIHICEALIYLESKSITHNDIKPGNIYRSKDGIYKLGDFGVARRTDEISLGGTLAFCAPETLSAGIINQTTDIYSLGVSLYALAGGDICKVRNRFSDDILPETENIGNQFLSVIMKACAFDAKERIKSAAELLECLKKISDVSDKTVPFIMKTDLGMTTTILPFVFPVNENETEYGNWDQFVEKQKAEMKRENIKLTEKWNYKVIYKMMNWLLFTCFLAMMPMMIFFLFRACFKQNFPYTNKVIIELLYFGLTLSIMTIKDLVSLDLWKKQKTVYIIVLFSSLMILILTAIFFGIMTANDMNLLDTTDANQSVLFMITISMAIMSFIVGACVQYLGVKE